jgi:dTDP-3-amino-3,4,6-trideoxy-alpha-D-glucose transaminase
VVPVVDLRRRADRQLAAFQAAVERVLRSGLVLLGPELEALEAELATWAGARHVVGLGSGAGALQLGLAALGVGPGDEVIVPAFTAVPTASAVCALGAVPVPVDVEAATAALDPDAARAAVTARTRAVMPVHLYGRPAAVRDFGVPVLEDAAQAHGALDGVNGRAAVYSFYPTKNLGGIGDGGVLVTDDDDVAAVVRRLRLHGMTEQYVHIDISQNFRMSELEAAWVRLLLPGLAAANERRADIARAYRSAAPHLCWPADHPRHVYHLCVVRVPDRDAFRTRLAAAGVATAVHYPLALTQQPAYRRFTRCACPEAEAWAARCVTLPCFPELTDDEVATVCRALEGL